MVVHWVGGDFFRAISFLWRRTFRLQSQGKNAIYVWPMGSSFLSRIFIVCSLTPHSYPVFHALSLSPGLSPFLQE